MAGRYTDSAVVEDAAGNVVAEHEGISAITVQDGHLALHDMKSMVAVVFTPGTWAKAYKKQD